MYRPVPAARLSPVVQIVYDELYQSGLLASNSTGGGNLSFGYLCLGLTLSPFSLTELSDDNPIDMLDFVANIGGFWGECARPSRSNQITCRYIVLSGAAMMFVSVARCPCLQADGSYCFSLIPPRPRCCLYRLWNGLDLRFRKKWAKKTRVDA